MIFGSTFAIKLVMTLFVQRFKMQKVIKSLLPTFKTSVGTSLISGIYLVAVWAYRQIQKWMVLRKNMRADSVASPEKSFGTDPQTPAWVHLIAGGLASTGSVLFTPYEKKLLKVFLYMKSIRGLIELIKSSIYKLISKDDRPKNLEQIIENQSGQNSLNADKKYLENDSKITSSIGEILFTSILITFCVYGYTVEPESMNRGMYNKIDKLFNL